MKIKPTAVTAFITALCLLPSVAYAEGNTDEPNGNTDTKYTLTFTDFDGNAMQTMEVSPDEVIDYSLVDTSSLHTHMDKYTERDFYTWSAMPEKINEDTTIQALYRKMTLSVDSLPKKTEFYTAKGDVSLNGLMVTIFIETQTSLTDENGDFYVATELIDITSGCEAKISDLAELFAESNTAEVNIMAEKEEKPLATYEITLFEGLGDTNSDGHVDSIDASYTLETYASLSTDNTVTLDENMKKICDVNRDGFVDSVDASAMLVYYSIASTEGSPVWEEIIPDLA